MPPPAATGGLRAAAAIAAGILLAAAAAAPVWIAQLIAPQYPKGLWLFAYGSRLEGDVREINALNHYIGMRPIDLAAVPELQLWLPSLAALAALALAGLFARGLPGAVSRALLWLFPFAILADIQRWLISYGRDLDPEAALRVKPFVPLVVGPTQVWNFKIAAYPGPAIVLLLAVALIVTLAARPGRRRVARRAVPRVAAAVIALVLLVGQSAPAAASGGQRSVEEIAAAIEAAAPGAEVRVAAGLYRGDLVIGRTVSLVAEPGTMLLGTGRRSVVTVTAPRVTVHGFAIHGSGGRLVQGAAVLVTADAATVSGNHVADAYIGVRADGVRDLRLVDNVIVGRAPAEVRHGGHDASAGEQGDGISLSDVTGALVRGNQVSGMRDGLYVSYSSDVLIDRNAISSSRYAIHAMYASFLAFENVLRENAAGVVAMYGGPIELARNRIQDHRAGGTGYGALVKDVSGVRLIENAFVRNSVGLRIEGVDRASGPADVLRNEIAYNGTGVLLLPSASLAFGANAFIENLVQVQAEGARANRSEWQIRAVGNHWSGYTGYDLGEDNIGDIPHREGGTAARLMDAAPELQLLRPSPAAFLLARVDRWWSATRATAIEDRSPLVRPITRLADPGRTAEPLPWVLLSGALAAAIAFGARSVRVRR